MADQVKNGAKQETEKYTSRLIDLSHRIHANPEVAFEEHNASRWVCDLLSDAKFSVEYGICDLPTAFKATVGSGPLHVAVCSEYDALPGVGHACGHNVIAATAVGAAIGAATVADDLGLRVTVIGTPAEELCDGGGKILLLERGAFEGVHTAMMVHPWSQEILEPSLIPVSVFEAHFTGKEAHFAAFPELGINAADALTVAQVAIGLLRLHIKSTDRVHGIITHAGDAPNIVPAHTSAKYMVRAKNLSELGEIKQRVLRCFEAGALASGSELNIVGGDKPYTEMLHDGEIAQLYRRNAESLGRKFVELDPIAKQRTSASTDMGNVSLNIPSIHPMIGLPSSPAVNHQPEFAAHCATPAADKALLDGSVGMAWTAIDMARNDAVRDRLVRRSETGESVGDVRK